MKKFRIVLLCLFVILVSGCDKTKTALKPEEFVDIVGSFKIDIVDITDDVDYADAVYRLNSNTYDFVYIDGKKKYDIEGLFVDQCKNVIDDIGSNTYKQDIGSGANWAKLEITTDEYYYYVSWIGDTYIYIKGSISDATVFREIIEKLGY